MNIFSSRKNIIATSIVALLVAFAFVSCEKRDDYYGRGNNGYSETIGFNIVNNHLQTRSRLAVVNTEKIAHKAILKNANVSDSLHLTTYISDMNMPGYIHTRASEFNDLSNGFYVYGYNFTSESDEVYDDLYIDNVKTGAPIDGDYSFSPSEYWPSGESQFFCYANLPFPTKVEGEERVPNDEVAPYVTISTSTGTPKLTYTVPTEIMDHKDVIVARSSRYPANTEIVPLDFYHIFTAVQFEFGTIDVNGIIESLSIEGVYLTGELNLGYGSTSDGFMYSLAWTRSNKANFTLAANATVNNNSTGDIATLENGYALMMIPQQLDGAKLVINYKDNGATEAVRLEANLIGTWGAGKVVTYKISLDEILNFGFTNTTELCLDAHYVMDNQLSIYAEGEVFDKGSNNQEGKLIVSSDQDWLTVKTELSDLQEDGWWIIEDKGTTSLELSSAPEGTRIWLIAEENNSTANRTAKITLTATRTGDTQDFTITQMCPHWNDEETLGSERIEEYPQRVPWGPFWHSSTDNYTITYTGATGLGDIIALLWHAIAGDGNVEVDVVFMGADKYTFNYKNIKDAFLENTLSTTSGLQNTIGGYSNAIIGTTSFKDFLFSINSNNKNVKPNFTEFIPTESAFVNVLKKNKFHKATKTDAGQTIEFADIDRAKTEETIVWYLPAKDEVMDGVYEENEKLHSCETPFDPFFDNDPSNDTWGTVFWTSTSVAGTSNQAWTYDFDTNETDEAPKDDGKEENNETGYRVRAVRSK